MRIRSMRLSELERQGPLSRLGCRGECSSDGSPGCAARWPLLARRRFARSRVYFDAPCTEQPLGYIASIAITFAPRSKGTGVRAGLMRESQSLKLLFELSGQSRSELNWSSPVRISVSAGNSSNSRAIRHGTNDTPLAWLRGCTQGVISLCDRSSFTLSQSGRRRRPNLSERESGPPLASYKVVR